MQKYTFMEHFAELKSRLIKIAVFWFVIFGICYYKSQEIYLFLVEPLASALGSDDRKVIYTSLTEAFFTYIKTSAFASFVITIPFISYQLYQFIAPGLHKQENKVAVYIFTLSPFLFWLGGAFVFYLVIPKAWIFFLSFEVKDGIMPLVLEARISEYLALVTQLIVAFGLAFQMPIILVILTLLGFVSEAFLQRKRRVAIVINFIIAGIVTPPDVLSQLALAIPMVLLYEISIVACKHTQNHIRIKT